MLLGAARTAFRIPCRADDPCAGDNCECEESLDEGEPSARWRQCPGARPAKRRQRFSKGGDKRGSVAAPQLAALRLGAKPELDCGGRRRGTRDPQHSDEGGNGGKDQKRNDERAEDDSNHSHDRFSLGANRTRGCHWRGSYEIWGVLAGDGEPSKTSCQIVLPL